MLVSRIITLCAAVSVALGAGRPLIAESVDPLLTFAVQPEPAESAEPELDEPDEEEAAVGPPARPRLFSRSLLGATGPSRIQRAPNMFGDLFFGGSFLGQGGGFFGQGGGHSSLTVAGGDRRFKIAENQFVRPADRIFFNYHHFHNALTVSEVGGVRDENLDRYTLGVEKSFACGCWSAELRIPIVDGLDNVQDIDFGGDDNVEFGNMSLTLKRLLRESETRACAIGVGMTFPTGADSVFQSGGADIFRVENTAFHLQPFIGWLFTLTDRHFLQLFTSFDFDTNGNDLRGGLNGTLTEQTLMMVDAQAGFWLYEDPCACYVTGVAPFVEIHYTTTLQNADTVGNVGNTFNRVDVLNLTGGVHVQLGPSSSVTAAAVAPLREDEERLFDAEVGVQFNLFY